MDNFKFRNRVVNFRYFEGSDAEHVTMFVPDFPETGNEAEVDALVVVMADGYKPYVVVMPISDAATFVEVPDDIAREPMGTVIEYALETVIGVRKKGLN